MTFSEYRQHDATALAELVTKGAITPEALLEIAMTRQAAVHDRINAVNHLMPDLAREMIRELPATAPFRGVPFLVKDLAIQVKGQPLTSGCKGYEGFVSGIDSNHAKTMRQAGLVFFGKTNTPEWGLNPFTEPSYTGITRNPWDTSRTAGGSSGGSGAAVAAGIVPMATASDGGGSIRIPASCNGLVGLKPSRGRISLGPIVGEDWAGAVVEGCVSRSVRDTARFLDAMSGYRSGDPYVIAPPKVPYAEAIKTAPGKLRIGYSTAHTLGHDVHPENIKGMEKTVALLKDLGHQVEEVPLPYQREDLLVTFQTVVHAQAAAAFHKLEQYLGRKARPSDVEATTWAQKMIGEGISARDYIVAEKKWFELGYRMAAFHEQYDLLLTPTLATPPFKIGALQPTATEQRLLSMAISLNLSAALRKTAPQVAEKVLGYICYPPIANMTGAPAISLPLHQSADGLPTGMMFLAEMGREDVLLQLAQQLEKEVKWFDRVAKL